MFSEQQKVSAFFLATIKQLKEKKFYQKVIINLNLNPILTQILAIKLDYPQI